MFDMNSMLLGAAVSGLCLSLTMLSFWSVHRGASFKFTWSIAVAVLVGHVVAYWFFAQHRVLLVGALACALLPVGTACLYAAARQFVDERTKPLPLILRLSVPYVLLVPPLFAAGFDGAALVAQNVATFALLVMAALVYLRVQREAPLAIGTMAALYVAAAATFLLCALTVAMEGQWSIGYPPNNWAEEINVVVSILAMTGVGALTLSVDQTRLAGRNEIAAMTDVMTGLSNRRALDLGRGEIFDARKAVILFDIDHFKQVNDRYGHAVGDDVIRCFAATMRTHGRAGDRMLRMGGEEFAIVMADATPEQARKVAERVSAAFAEAEMRSRQGEPFRCTVSAGIAFGHVGGVALDDVIARADKALYAAKRGGRNRVETGEWRLVG